MKPLSKSKNNNKISSEILTSELEVRIEKLAVGGWGLSRVASLSGIVCFVPDSAPGDHLKVKVIEVQKNHLVAEILQILEAGPQRRTPPCPQASICGGCDWQHLEEPFQLQQKEDLLADSLKKFLPTHSVTILPIRKSPKSFNYRSRIQPKMIENELGFYAKRSHKLVPISECLIAESALNSLFKKDKPILKNGKMGTEEDPLRLEFFLDDQNLPRVRNLEEASDEDLGFTQINQPQNEELIDWVLKLVRDQSFSKIYDFYAGAGNFTLPLSKVFKKTQVIAVEKHTVLALRGREKALKKPIEFFNTSVELFIRRHALPENALILLDPPRAGADPLLMKTLALSNPQKIIYISCNPVTMARDLQVYFEEIHKNKSENSVIPEILSIQPFEMFPQTSHMETIVEIGPRLRG